MTIKTSTYKTELIFYTKCPHCGYFMEEYGEPAPGDLVDCDECQKVFQLVAEG